MARIRQISVFILFYMIGKVLSSSCYYVDQQSGNAYNLTTLAYDPSSTPPPGYTFTDNLTPPNVYSINFCQLVSSSTGCTIEGESLYPGVCQHAQDGDYYITGSLSFTSFTEFVPDALYSSGIGLVYSGGQVCKSGTARVTTIYIACDYGNFPGSLYFAEEDPTCTYTLRFASSSGCPVDSSAGNVCLPSEGCNVCPTCCKSYLAYQADCDACVEQECAQCATVDCNLCNSCCPAVYN